MALLNSRGGLLKRNNNLVIPPDPNFNNVVFLSQFDGAVDGTIFTDVKGHTITRNGLAVTAADIIKFGSAALKLVPTNDFLQVTNIGTDFTFGTGAFTLESWIYPTGTGIRTILDTPNWAFNVSSGNGLEMVSSNFAFIFSANNLVTLNAWNFVAARRSANTFSLWVGNTSVASTIAIYDFSSTGNLRIGRNAASTTYFNGRIDSTRITKGVARDLSVVPTTAFAEN